MGIPILYFRSSSYNCHRMCEMQYYGEYGLGYRGESNKKADKGTIVHKALEILAACKKARQDGEKEIFDKDLNCSICATNEEIEFVDEISGAVYHYYTSRIKHHEWTEKDYKDCAKWVWKTIDYNNGMFDPRKREIVAVEPFFDLEIKDDWAKFDYPELGLKGNLSLKGTVDLVTKVDDGVYEIIDYKTGKRLDWATGKEKTQESLNKDPQLRIYHYAAKTLFPEAHTVIVTIIYINAGGAFSVFFGDDSYDKTEALVKEKFEHIRDTKVPQIVRERDPTQGWKCRKLCHLGKTTFEDVEGVKALKEGRVGQYTRYGQVMSKCEQLRYMIKKKGIEWVTENMKDPDHIHGHYSAPGQVEDVKEDD